MTINYIDPLSRAWGRMKKALFHPFDISKWLVVGFTAFLAGLMDWHKGGDGDSKYRGRGRFDYDDFLEFPGRAWEWLLDNPGWFVLIVIGLVCFILFIVLLTWLSSRGKFMFLDNVVHDRAQVVKPWHEFKIQGNSLFLWRLCFGFICFVLVITFLVFCFFVAYNLHESYAPRQMWVLAIVGMVLLGLTMIIITGYITVFLNDFVVPIMYKHDMRTFQAWSRFLPLFSRHFWYFLFWGIIMFLLHILAIICVLVLGLFTCCIGIILVIIPYIGSVITLPISYTFRAFSLEFLEQFGPDYTLFPKAEEA